jgi:transposase
MRAYSEDLREKIIEVHESEALSQRELARRFKVSLNFIVNLLRLYRETGSLTPRPRPGRQPTKLTPAVLEHLEEKLEKTADATLAELRDSLAEHLDIHLGISTVHNALVKLGYRRKKNRFILSRKRASEFSLPAKTTGVR